MLQFLPLAQVGLFAGLGAFLIVLWIVAILLSVFWIWMLIDCLTSSMPSTEKLIWALVIIFTHFIGALIYFFVQRRGPTHRLA